MFIAITTTIFVGGAGAVIIGGLYWKRGTTTAAWFALITGAVLSIGQLALDQIFTRKGIDFPLNGMWQSFVASIASIAVYVIISLFQKRIYDFSKLLISGDTYSYKEKLRLFFALGPEFTIMDKSICYISIGWGVIWTLILFVGTIYNLLFEVSDAAWQGWWKFNIILFFALGVITTVWLILGGILDVKRLVVLLSKEIVDESDDGWIPSSKQHLKANNNA
jgi:SSS family solute:Na+ symporter